MRLRPLIVWFAIGLLGLALAAGVTYAATQLSSQRIGLSAEPPSAGEELAVPPRTRTTGSTTPDPDRRDTREAKPHTSGGPLDGDRDLDD